MTRVVCLTVDTSNALFITLTGISALIKLLLSKGFNYVLPGTFQSDPWEGEFGVFRQSPGGMLLHILPANSEQFNTSTVKIV